MPRLLLLWIIWIQQPQTASAVHRIGLIQNPCPIFKVQVANGPPVMIQTVCTLQVRIQDHKSGVRAYVLPDGLSTVDLLWGRTWLGEYRANLNFSPKLYSRRDDSLHPTFEVLKCRIRSTFIATDTASQENAKNAKAI